MNLEQIIDELDTVRAKLNMLVAEPNPTQTEEQASAWQQALDEVTQALRRLQV